MGGSAAVEQEFENLALLTFDTPGALGGLDNVAHLRNRARIGQVTAAVLADLDAPTIDTDAFDTAASWLFLRFADDMDQAIPGWDRVNGVVPENADEWRGVIDWLIARTFDTGGYAAAAAAAEYAQAREQHYSIERVEGARHAARLALADGVLTKTVDMSGRLRRDLARMLDQYATLKGGG